MPPADPSKPGYPRECYQLTIRQNPVLGKAVGNRLSDRRPLDPPPVVRLTLEPKIEPSPNYLQSPYYFVACTLWDPVEDRPATYNGPLPPLAGTLVSSLYKLKDPSGSTSQDGGFFVFGDVCVRPEGEFRLQFVMYEVLDGEVNSLSTCVSNTFRVHTTKTFPGIPESTYLAKAFADQGVRLRIRKEGRISTYASRVGNMNNTDADRKRYARTQNVGDEEAYETKPEPSPVMQSTSSFSADSTYMLNRNEYQQRMLKRPRMSTELGTTPSLRDTWSLSSSTSTPGLSYPLYQQSFPQAFPQQFSTSSSVYGAATPSFQNMVPYPRTGQDAYWQSQPRTDPVNMSYRYMGDSMRQV